MKLLALDVGERRVGVAVSDSAAALATPLTVIRRRSKAEDFGKIVHLMREQCAEALVIGLPLNADGSAGPQAQRVERYAAALAEVLKLEQMSVELTMWDEHGSTQRAQALMIDAGQSAKKRRQKIDAAAAAVILQDYLDAQSQSIPDGATGSEA